MGNESFFHPYFGGVIPYPSMSNEKNRYTVDYTTQVYRDHDKNYKDAS